LVVVHDEPESSKQTVDALRLVGYEVAAFSDPMAALEKAQRVEMLIKLACAFRRETKRRRSGSDCPTQASRRGQNSPNARKGWRVHADAN
jgi:CheY-like chemotaxis protein